MHYRRYWVVATAIFVFFLVETLGRKLLLFISAIGICHARPTAREQSHGHNALSLRCVSCPFRVPSGVFGRSSLLVFWSDASFAPYPRSTPFHPSTTFWALYPPPPPASQYTI
ncbi:hypothetical protein B0H14DRAFT_3510476 [Mycena olivaceomarginata]|nr:hypothetical protein B0H14DRAFT_3510476 [Mycena olivaceomarginata]